MVIRPPQAPDLPRQGRGRLHGGFRGRLSAAAKRLALAAVLACSAGGLAGAPALHAAETPAAAPLEIHTFSDLLKKAELIVLAEVGETDVYGTRLKVLHVLKEPPAEALLNWIDPDKVKRAEDLLTQEAETAAQKEPAPAEAAPAEKPVDPKATTSLTLTGKRPDFELPPVAVVPEGRMKLPEAGSQWVFFLWDRLAAGKKVPLRYRLAHPQCLYKPDVAAEVKVEVSKRLSTTRRKYLREWDQKMAEKVAARLAQQSVLALKAGHGEKGLALVAQPARRSIRNDNTFDIAVRFENERGYDQAVYDGPVSAFGVRLKRADDPAAAPLVLMFKQERLTDGLDPTVLSIVDATDFAQVPAQGSLRKDLHFSAKDHPELKALNGAYVANVFYLSDKDGQNVENLTAAPWTGAVVSQDIPLELKAAPQAEVELVPETRAGTEIIAPVPE